MNDSELNKIEQIKSMFKKSIAYQILREFMNNNSDIKTLFEKINLPNENVEIDSVEKYETTINEAIKLATTFMPSVTTISSLYQANNLRNTNPITEPEKTRCKTILDELKNTFEDLTIRRELTNTELYNIYSHYIELSNYANNNQLSNEMLDEVESNLKPIFNKFWEKDLTDIKAFKQGTPFRFLVHTTIHSKKIDDFKRKDRVSCSYITENEMGTYPTRVGYILDISGLDDIVRICPQDMGTIERNGENFIGNAKSTALMMPSTLEQKCVEQNKKHSNGKILVNEEHNEILKTDFNPTAIFCITLGEKDLSMNYNTAKKLSEDADLTLIDIDILDYRMRYSKYYTDEELITEKERELLVKGVVNHYFGKHNPSMLEQPMQMEEIYIRMQDSIAKLFLKYKKECFSNNEQFDVAKFESTLDNIFGLSSAVDKSVSNKTTESVDTKTEVNYSESINLTPPESRTIGSNYIDEVESAKIQEEYQKFELVNNILNREIPELLWDIDGNEITEQYAKDTGVKIVTDYANQGARIDRRAELNKLSLQELLDYEKMQTIEEGVKHGR